MQNMKSTIFCFIIVLLISLCLVQQGDCSLYQHPYQAYETLAQRSMAASSFSDLENVDFYKFWQRGELNSAFSKSKDKYELPGELTEECASQFIQTLDAATNLELWAMQMFDAWGKPEAGFMTGIFNWLGDYPECLAINSSGIHGRYCTGTYQVQMPFNGDNVTAAYQLGMCLPSACAADDAASLYTFILQIISPGANATGFCQPLNEERVWTGLAKTAYAVYGIMLVLCLSAGLYDYLIHGTAMYYMVHSLPIPASLYPRGKVSVRADAVVSDDEGSLIQNSVSEEEQMGESTVLRRCEPTSKGEQILLKVKRWFLLFSCYTSGYKILSAEHFPGSIQCIHGIRFLSLSWVILGHTLVFSIGDIASMQVLLTWINRLSFEVITNGSLSVDSFFMLSGSLSTYLMLKDFHSRQIGGKAFLKSVPVLYLHRYLRLTPALAFMVLFWAYGLYYVTNGPIWMPGPVTDLNCQNNSWATLLYINNLYYPENECAAWTWYLANDFQFFLVVPFIAGLMYWKELAGVAVAVLLVLTSCLSCIIVTAQHNLGVSMSNNAAGGAMALVSGPWFKYYYVPPWARYQAFGVGTLVGYAVWKSNGKLNIHWALNLMLWLLSAAFCMLPIYAIYKDNPQDISLTEAIFYNSFNRTSWCLGLGYLVLACHCGRGGWINDLLSWRGFIPLSRMTYCAYLIHPVVMTTVAYSRQSLERYTILVFVQSYMSFLFIAYCLAFVFSLLFEAPFLNIDKYFITGPLQGKKKNG